MAFLGFSPVELKSYLILSLCWLSIVQVNLLEQPYARSLVVCDVPVNTTVGAPFAGSQYCGDRLHVINVGADISGKGQSLENFGRICITLFVSAFADRGRRGVAILGQSLICASTLLFFLASFIGRWAIPVYAIAQGLQGMSGIGILDQIVTGDVALQLGDSVGVYQRKGMYNLVMGIICFPMVLYVQYAEVTDFTWVWLAVNTLNFSALALLLMFFPETLPQAESATTEGSMLGVVRKECQQFSTMLRTDVFIRCRVLEQLAIGLGDTSSIGFPFLMANFGFSQFNALLVGFLPGMVLSPVFMPFVPYLHRRYGYRWCWQLCYWVSKLWCGLCLFGVPGVFYPMLTSFGGIPGPCFMGLGLLPFCGFASLGSAVEIRLVGQAKNAKFQAMLQLTGFLTGFVSSYVYSQVFDAEATSAAGRNAPQFLSFFWLVVQLPIFVYGIGPVQLGECDRLTAEEAEAAQAEGDKKSD